MKKLLSLLVMCSLVFVFAACEPNEVIVEKEVEKIVEIEPEIFTPGTYREIAIGRKGLVTVDVTFDKTHITNVVVVSHSESKGLSDQTIEEMPLQIVKYQTVNIDGYAGATFTGYAIKSAVSKAIVTAGGDKNMFNDEVMYDYEMVELEAEYDYAIAGGGLAGMMSAITAAEKGLSVVLFEQNSYLGGSLHAAAGTVSGAGHDELLALIEAGTCVVGTHIKEKYTSAEAYAADRWKTQQIPAGEVGYNPNADTSVWTVDTTPKSYAMHKEGTETVNWIIDKGVTLNSRTPLCTSIPDLGDGPFTATGEFSRFLESELEYLGVTIVKNTEVTNIIMENGAAAGLKVTDVVTGELREVSSSAVLIATGGFMSNADMVAEYYDEYVDPVSAAMTTADGSSIELGTEVGADTVGMELGFSQLWITARSHIEVPFFHFDGLNFAKYGTPGIHKKLHVDGNGDFYTNPSISYRDWCHDLMQKTGDAAYIWMVWDQDLHEAELANVTGFGGTSMEELINLGDVQVFDSVEEAADKIGGNFLNTVSDWNNNEGNINDSGETLDGGKTIYAMKVLPSIYQPYGGLKTDIDLRVIDTNGNVIPGLYAAGDAIGSPERQEGMKYTAGVTVAMSFGRVAAETVVEDKE